MGVATGSGLVAAAAKAKGLAAGRPRTTDTFSVTGNAARVARTTDERGTRSSFAAQTRGTLGRGAITLTVPEGNPVGTTGAQVRAYFGRGSLVGDFNTAHEPLPDGRTSFRGTGIVRSGGGDLRGARGRFSVDGTLSADGETVSFAAAGRFTR